MKQELWERVYESMACCVVESHRMPGVEDAFSHGSFCMEKYNEMRDAYDRLCDRLRVADEDDDVECIIQCYMAMQRELCRRMFFTVRGQVLQNFHRKTQKALAFSRRFCYDTAVSTQKTRVLKTK